MLEVFIECLEVIIYGNENTGVRVSRKYSCKDIPLPSIILWDSRSLLPFRTLSTCGMLLLLYIYIVGLYILITISHTLNLWYVIVVYMLCVLLLYLYPKPPRILLNKHPINTSTHSMKNSKHSITSLNTL